MNLLTGALQYSRETTHTQQKKRIALIGCGTHNQLLALKLIDKHINSGQLSITVFDSKREIDLAKTISCHTSDVPHEIKSFMTPYWKCSWPSYLVRFPSTRKSAARGEGSYQSIDLGYHVLDLALMQAKLEAAAQLHPELIEFVWNVQIHSHSDLARWLEAKSLPAFDLIIDTRSPAHRPSPGGVQQFYGATYRFSSHHGYKLPVIMDAACLQPIDQPGYRFVYFLPLNERELLIEDTRLVLRPDNFSELEAHVQSLARQIGQTTQSSQSEIVHNEKGLIPIPFLKHRDWILAHSRESNLILEQAATAPPPVHIRAGMGAGFFHPTTGYSLPLTLSSVAIIDKHLFEPGELLRAYTRFERRAARSWNFALLFNAFLFFGFKPSDSLHAFSYFYRLPCSFIRAFYSCRLHALFLWVLLTRPPPARFQTRSLFTCLKQWLCGPQHESSAQS